MAVRRGHPYSHSVLCSLNSCKSYRSPSPSELKATSLGGGGRGQGVCVCVGGVTSRGGTLQIFSLCVCGGTQFAYCSRLGSETPSHSREGFLGNRKRVGEWSLNTYVLTQQLETFKSLTGVPAPPYSGLVSSTSQRIGVLSPGELGGPDPGPQEGALTDLGRRRGVQG